MMTLLFIYLLIGSILGLVVWWAAFDSDYDQFVRDFYREEPPSKNEKIVTILLSPVLWPLFVWWLVRHG